MSVPKSTPIQIAYVVNDLKLGGAQMMILELASRLNKEKFVATVYYLNSSYGDTGNLEAEFKNAGIKTVCVGSSGKVGLLKGSYRLFKFWLASKPDVVHAHLPYAVLTSSLASLCAPTVKLVLHEHQSPSHFSRKIRFLRTLLRPRSQVTICYSEGVERDVFGEAHILKSVPENLVYPSYTIHNGVDVKKIQQLKNEETRSRYRIELRCTDADVLVMAVARFIPWKGQSVLLDAFLSCAKDIPQLRLCLVGAGVTYDSLLERADMSEFKDRIVFTGDRKDALGLLSAADIVSLVYNYPEGKEGDSVGIAGCEALAMGLPLLAGSNLDIIDGLEDGKNIQLVIPGDTVALATALSSLVHNQTKRQELGDTARIFAERNLNWRNIVPIYERIYLLLMNV